MNFELSPQNEQYLEQVVAGGFYPSKGAALDAAVAALRALDEEIPFVPDEHMEAVEQALEDAAPSRLMTADDWARLRELARNAASRNNQSND